VKGLNDLLVGRFLAFGDAVVVVQFARPVEAQTDVEVFLGEKFAPFVVDGGAVGLDAVDDLLVGRQMFLLKVDRFAEELDAE
jgi:hypothetical protein